MPASRDQFALATGADGRIYAIGGADAGSSTDYLTEVFVYDPSSKSWSDGPDFNVYRGGVAATTAPNGTIYAVGGRVEDDGNGEPHTVPLGAVETLLPGPAPPPPGHPSPQFYMPSHLTTGSSPTVPIRMHWTASSQSGVSYELQDNANTVYFGSRTQFKSQFVFNSSDAFRVRSWSGGTYASYWQKDYLGGGFTVLRYQESSLSNTGTWTATANTQLWGGTGEYAKAAGASASITFVGRTFAIIGNKGPGNGSAKLYVDGVAKTTMNEHATATSYRNIVGTWGWSTRDYHTIKIVNLATSGQPRFDIDGIVVIQ
jgi:hypothetical protein